MTNKIGVLSDTHLAASSAGFCRLVEQVFSDCSIIIHAGDITDLSVLDAFSDKLLYAVHGNMCSMEVRRRFPESQTVRVDGFSISVCHGAGLGYSIEDRLYDRFADSDCIVYGHTHQPANHRVGEVLLLNPGSFAGTGRHGSPGSYAILETSQQQGLQARIQTIE